MNEELAQHISTLSREMAIINAKMVAHDDAFLSLLKAMAEGHQAATTIYVDGFQEVLDKIDKKIIEVVDEKIRKLG